MLKALQVADEIVGLLGGERGLARLGIHSVQEFEDGISAFVKSKASDIAVVVIRKAGKGYTIAIQTLLPPIRFSSYEVKGKYLKSALRMELWRRKG